MRPLLFSILILGSASAREPLPSGSEPKSESVAFGLSTVGTLVPLGILAGSIKAGSANGLAIGSVGLAIGPALGQLYGQAFGPASVGIGIRAAGAGLAMIGIRTSINDCFGGPDKSDSDSPEPSHCGESLGATMAVSGMCLLVIGTLYGLTDAAESVRRFNARPPAPVALGVAPTLLPGPDGSLRTGAVAWVRF